MPPLVPEKQLRLSALRDVGVSQEPPRLQDLDARRAPGWKTGALGHRHVPAGRRRRLSVVFIVGDRLGLDVATMPTVDTFASVRRSAAALGPTRRRRASSFGNASASHVQVHGVGADERVPVAAEKHAAPLAAQPGLLRQTPRGLEPRRASAAARTGRTTSGRSPAGRRRPGPRPPRLHRAEAAGERRRPERQGTDTTRPTCARTRPRARCTSSREARRRARPGLVQLVQSPTRYERSGALRARRGRRGRRAPARARDGALEARRRRLRDERRADVGGRRDVHLPRPTTTEEEEA